MKTKIYTIIILFFLLVATSCESWLDETANTEIKAEDQFTSEEGFKNALIGIYLNMSGRKSYAQDLTWKVMDLVSQQYADYTSASIGSNIQSFNYETPGASKVIDNMWHGQYNLIANINSALKYIDKNKGVLNTFSYSIIKGELLALRAFFHLDLLRIYGHGNIANRSDLDGKLTIPYVTEYKKEATPQLSYDKTFELLLNDLDQAIELLKEDPIYPNPDRPADYYKEDIDGFFNIDSRVFRMNYYAALATKVRVLTWMGGEDNMANASTIAQKIIAERFSNTISGGISADNIFSVVIPGFEDIYTPYLSAENSIGNEEIYFTDNSVAELYETDNTNIGIADVRFNAFFTPFSHGKICKKLMYQLRKVGVYEYAYMPLIKLPELLYVIAEYNATKASPSLDIAINVLNSVRKSRGIIEDIPANADKPIVENEIMKEYRKEFVFEGQLFYFYKRKGLITFPGLESNIEANDKIYMLPYPSDEIQFGNRVQF